MLRRGAQALTAAAVLSVLLVPVAHAAFGVESFDARVVDDEGNLFEQAGGHPFEGYTAFAMNTLPSGAPDGHVKDIRVDVPPGLISNPQAVPQCSDAQLAISACPANAQIGRVNLTTFMGLRVGLELPLYNMTIGPNQVSRFAFNPQQALLGAPGAILAAIVEPLGITLKPVEIIGGVRDASDYGLFFTISDVADNPEIVDSRLTFWGVPGLPDHNAQRGRFCVSTSLVPIPVCAPGGQLATAGRIPFLTNPTTCSGPLPTTRLSVASHEGPTATATSTLPEVARNCEDVPFEPDISFGPATVPRDAPFGFAFNLHVPQSQEPDVLGTAHVENVSVTLPPGMTISPSAANGLEACTDAQFAQGTHDPIACPAASRLGDAQISTPLLADALNGGVYLGQPLPGDRYRLFLNADARGVTVRLKGSIRPDPAAGQLTTVFEDNPQVPFSNFTLTFRDGPLAPVASPPTCGNAAGSSNLSPWSEQPAATPSAAVDVTGCDGYPFAPTLGAGTRSPAAGAFTPFALALGRDDGHQPLAGVDVDLPPGLLGMLARVDQCPDAQAASGACPAGSRIGTASVEAGPGAQPFGLSGPAYLTGPYKGAPFGMVVVIRALAGPFDLGTVVVRQRIQVDPEDAHVSVVSDPLPQILEGVPLRLRSVRVDVDRAGFMRNPTSCGAKQVSGVLGSALGAGADVAASFPVDACDALRFAPKLGLKLTGAKQLDEGEHPGVRATATQGEGQAGIQSTKVSLPLALALDPGNAEQLCSVEDAQRATCPQGSIIGGASASSPILHKPLAGPVYFVQGVRTDPTTGRQIRTLPTLLATLRGEVAINVRAVTSVERGHLVTTFPTLPDAPISRFALEIEGGGHGILVANRNLCGSSRKLIAKGYFGGHNGKAKGIETSIGTPCKKKSPKLKLGKVARSGNRLLVTGSVAKAAKGRLEVGARCAGKAVSKRAKPKRGRWRTTLRLPGRCADGRMLEVTARYAGGAGFAAAAVRARTTRG